jgi:hypothetical protein
MTGLAVSAFGVVLTGMGIFNAQLTVDGVPCVLRYTPPRSAFGNTQG